MKCRSSTTVGFRVFWKGGGVPLPVSIGVLTTCDFGEDPKGKIMVKNHQKTRRVCIKIPWHERNTCHAFLIHLQLNLRTSFQTCHTILIQFIQHSLQWIQSFRGWNLRFWDFFLFLKWYVTPFWYMWNVKWNVTWRTLERWLSHSVQTTFFAPKRV